MRKSPPPTNQPTTPHHKTVNLYHVFRGYCFCVPFALERKEDRDGPAGYGSSGLQITGIDIPTPGCREITATAYNSVLTFVVYAVPRP